MEVKKKRGRKKALSHKGKFLEYSRTFEAFGRLFKTTAGKSMLQAERDEVMAKVCTGLSEVCKMLAEAPGDEEAKRQATKRVAELITLFSRCRRGQKVKECSECDFFARNFQHCPHKAEHDEWWQYPKIVDLEDAYPFLPDDVAEEIGLRR